MEAEDMTDSSPRCCYICLGTEGDRPGRGHEWVSPCRCTGSTRWVHVRCVRRWVREVESTSLGRPVHCPLCRTPYTLVPTLGPVVRALHYWNRRVYAVFRQGIGYMTFNFLYNITCVTLGGFATFVVYGWSETEVLVTTDFPFVVFAMQWIGMSLGALSVAPWENWVLQGLRKASRFPVLKKFLPEEAPPGYGIRTPRLLVTTALKEAALLPVCSKVVGEMFFSDVGSPLTRALLGGITFILVKGGFVMFYRQKLMIRHKTMAIRPFVQMQP